MNGRTDLALEATLDKENTTGVSHRVTQQDDCTVTHTTVHTTKAAAQLGKPCGRYITIEHPLLEEESSLPRIAGYVSAALSSLLPSHGIVLVVGLGNPAITPDALGPQAVDQILATRHIRGELARSLGLEDLRPVAVVHAGVLGKTGVESAEAVAALCHVIHPAAVIVIDALAARSLTRLGRTVQLCDTGISPGAGVGNNRAPLDRALLGVPVIGIGVPMVVDAATVIAELSDGEANAAAQTMMVTPRDVDLLLHRAARLIAVAVNGALQPNYNPVQLSAAAL